MIFYIKFDTFDMKAAAAGNAPCSIKDVAVNKQENKLTPIIICTEDTLYWEKSFP